MSDRPPSCSTGFLDALGLPGARPEVTLHPGGTLPSAFGVSDLAQASIGAAGAALARLAAGPDGAAAAVRRRPRPASAWFTYSLRPEGWQLPPAWDSVAGDYARPTGGSSSTPTPRTTGPPRSAYWECPASATRVAAEVARWEADGLEAAVVGAGGAAAALRTVEAWDAHPRVRRWPPSPSSTWSARSPPVREPVTRRRAGRPLAGLRVLDLTRVLAGPVATRLLAGWGADVLRVDPPGWDEPNVVPEVTLGKRCTRLDLHEAGDRAVLLDLLAGADVVVHGYRPGALDGLGLGAGVRRAARPGIVDVGLDAYGWTGAWSGRRGFDSLVQMSSGIAAAGSRAAGADGPVPLPVQALDHATGYLLAAAVLAGLALRRQDGHGSRWRTSLARMARLLVDAGVAGSIERRGIDPGGPAPDAPVERTAWGDARRLPPPVVVEGAPLRWDLPAGPLGSAPAVWPGR